MSTHELFDFFEHHNALDIDGRPLSEDPGVSSPARFETARCGFDDYRNSLPINVSAYRHLCEHLHDIQATYRAIRALLYPHARSFTYSMFWQVAQFARWYPIYFLRTDPTYVPSAVAAGVYKSARGLHDLAVHCIGTGHAPNTPFEMAEALAVLSTTKALVNKAGRACPASTKLISQFLACIAERPPSLPDGSESGRVGRECRAILRYANHLHDLELLANCYAVIRRADGCSLTASMRARTDLDALLLFGRVTPMTAYLSAENGRETFKRTAALEPIDFDDTTRRRLLELFCTTNTAPEDLRVGLERALVDLQNRFSELA